jgi:Domain of unknown function (DUF4157)
MATYSLPEFSPTNRGGRRDSASPQTTPAATLPNEHAWQRKRDQGLAASRVPVRGAPTVVSGSGAPLPEAIRADMESRFAHDFSRVRTHTGDDARRAAQAQRALAFTVGHDIVFAAQENELHTGNGRRLLVHELAHVVQQNRGSSSPSISSPEALELHAENAAAAFQDRSRPIPVSGMSAIGVACKKEGQNASSPRNDNYSANPQVVESTPDYSKMTWQQLLPRAHGNKGTRITAIDLHTPGNRIDKWGTGKDPTLNYASDNDIHTDPASAAPQGGVGGSPEADALTQAQTSDLSAAQDAAISQIITARAKIPDRPMGRSRNNNAGYDYNPDTDPAAREYSQWTKSALPTGVKDSDWDWQVFKKIQGLEGQEGRFTTFDKTLSVGPGYSTSGGQTQHVIGRTFNLLPEVKSVAFDAGLTLDASGAMTVVDTDKRWILESQDAAAYIQTEVSLLSLLVNVSQGTQPVRVRAGDSLAVAPEEQKEQRQALLDTEWRQFLDGTLANMTSLVQGWPMDSAVLAIHAKHAQPGNFPFTFWNTHDDPGLATMVAAIYGKVGESAKYICTGKYAQYIPS